MTRVNTVGREENLRELTDFARHIVQRRVKSLARSFWCKGKHVIDERLLEGSTQPSELVAARKCSCANAAAAPFDDDELYCRSRHLGFPGDSNCNRKAEPGETHQTERAIAP